MLPSLLVAVTLTAPGAPIPKDIPTNPSGPAPRILAVKANDGGGVTIIATIYEKRKIQQQFFVIENGKQVMKQQETEVMTQTYIQKELGDFGGKFATADGATLNAEQATKRAKDGATILITADGKPIDPGWLRVVGTDTVVMFTSELAQAQFQFGHSSLPSTPNPRLVMLGTDSKGNVRIPVNPNGANIAYYDDFGGFQNNVRVFRGGMGGRMVIMNGNVMPVDGDGSEAASTKPAGPDGKKPLEDIRFDAYDLTGKLIPKAEAMKRLKAGGLALFAGDNRFPDSDYLKAFREDMIVLVSAEFVFPPGIPNPYDAPAKQPVAPAGKLAPAAPQAVVAPAVQVVPVLIQRKVVLDAVKEAQAEKPAEKPQEEKAKEKVKEKADEKTPAKP